MNCYNLVADVGEFVVDIGEAVGGGLEDFGVAIFEEGLGEYYNYELYLFFVGHKIRR